MNKAGIKSLWQKIFKWGPKHPMLRILWIFGLVLTKPFKHGEKFTRYKMYLDLKKVIRKNNIQGKILSISQSYAICKYIKRSEIFEANYPEYNWLNLPFPAESFDCVVADMVIEHVEGDPQAVIKESHRVLKKGGYLILTTNFVYPWHGCPKDFWRFSRDGLIYICNRLFSVVASGEAGNISFIIAKWLGIQNLPVPHFKYHPLHFLACKVNPKWANVTWSVARK